MNIVKRVMTMEVSEAVEKGAEIFANAERRARKTKEEFRELRAVFEAVRDAGHIGALECQELASDLDAFATAFEAGVWARHSRLTKRCRELGIDLPETLDGGGPR